MGRLPLRSSGDVSDQATKTPAAAADAGGPVEKTGAPEEQTTGRRGPGGPRGGRQQRGRGNGSQQHRRDVNGEECNGGDAASNGYVLIFLSWR